MTSSNDGASRPSGRHHADPERRATKLTLRLERIVHIRVRTGMKTGACGSNTSSCQVPSDGCQAPTARC